MLEGARGRQTGLHDKWHHRLLYLHPVAFYEGKVSSCLPQIASESAFPQTLLFILTFLF